MSIIGAFAIIAFVIYCSPTHKADAQPSSISEVTTATASSTLVYLGNGTATSTYQFDSYPTYSSSKPFSMAGIDAEYLFLEFTASSTATQFTITPQFSNNGSDWYNATTTTTVFTFASATSTLTGNSIPIVYKLPDISAMHERVVFSALGAPGAIYAEVILKKNPSGQ